MDFSRLLTRAWNLIWKNKALLFLGMLAVLSGAGGGGGSQAVSGGQGIHITGSPDFDFPLTRPWQGLGMPVLPIAVISILVLIGLALWALGNIARGGLISGAAAADRGEEVLFGEALRDGLDQGWRLIGTALIPAIPTLLLAAGAAVSAVLYLRSTGISFEGRDLEIPNAAGAAILIPITCFLVTLALALSLLRSLANRACMLEDLGVLASYRRGWEVLGQNLGSVLILFLLQIVLSVGLGLALLVPLAISALCCFLWPVLWFVQGSFAALYSTLWTLAWKRWTAAEVDAPTS